MKVKNRNYKFHLRKFLLKCFEWRKFWVEIHRCGKNLEKVLYSLLILLGKDAKLGNMSADPILDYYVLGM